jgi:hypothetical protein
MSESQDTKDEKPKTVTEQAQTPHAAVVFPFDVVVVAEGAASRKLSPTEFFALPLAERIKYVVQQKASFFAEGQAVDSRVVLGHMRKIRSNLH